jgi:hypothetical protein
MSGSGPVVTIEVALAACIGLLEALLEAGGLLLGAQTIFSLTVQAENGLSLCLIA